MNEEEQQEVLDELIELLQQAEGNFQRIRGAAQATIDDARSRGMAVGARLRQRGHAGLTIGEWDDWNAYVNGFLADMGRDPDP